MLASPILLHLRQNTWVKAFLKGVMPALRQFPWLKQLWLKAVS
ncbi:MAG: hypothetical protein AAF329_08220 [Cyanobacteria bacterium P01_A01_bin.17]